MIYDSFGSLFCLVGGILYVLSLILYLLKVAKKIVVYITGNMKPFSKKRWKRYIKKLSDFAEFDYDILVGETSICLKSIWKKAILASKLLCILRKAGMKQLFDTLSQNSKVRIILQF